MATENTDSGF